MISLPSDFNVTTNNDAPRLTIPQVVNIIKGVIDGVLPVNHVSHPNGAMGDEWCEVRTARGDILCFFIRQECCTNIFFARTPSGKEWRMDVDGGSPLVGQSIEIQQAATRLFYKPVATEKVEVETVYRVIVRKGDQVMPCGPMMDRGHTKAGLEFPTELGVSPIFYDMAAAKKAADRYSIYRAACHKEGKGTVLKKKKDKS